MASPLADQPIGRNGTVTDRVYAILSGDDREDRACEVIPDSVCTEVPRNYVLNVINGACTKLAEQLASPGLTLPWLLAAIGAPAGLVGFLSPIKQVGSLLPQLAVAARVRALPLRKWVWVGAGGSQAMLLFLMVPAALLLPPVAAGLTILLLLALFSLASGAGSVAFQDVVGKTIPKGRRGRMLANRAAIGGGLTLLAGLSMRLWLEDTAAVAPYLWLVAAAAGLWALGAFSFAAIEEDPGATAGGRNAIEEARHGVGLVRRQPGYRQYLGARAVLTSVEVAMPLFVLHAHGLVAGSATALGVFVLSVGAANVVSSPVWGAMSDRTARQVMMLSGLLGAAAGLLALALGWLLGTGLSAWVYAPVFVVLGLAEAGARLGRKTYLVDAAPKEERPLYVAFANSTIGLVALLLGTIGLLAQFATVETALAALIILGLLAAYLAARMPEAEAMVDDSRGGEAST